MLATNVVESRTEDSGTSASDNYTQFPIIQVAETFFDKESDVHITSLYLISLQV